ncbi:MAG: flagellar hook-basal body protein, partial [Clostridiales bacterium]|nr:flagellar hook-basal body protein [Clostridiales bacterium]
MLRGLYTSALGMTTQMNRMDVLSNNIANVNTNAFKKDKVITQSFSEEFMKRLNDNPDDEPKIFRSGAANVGKYAPGLFVDDLHTDFTAGSLKTTGGTFDLAVIGDGFFAVSVTDNNGETVEQYTRDGAFTLNQDRVLVTKDGFFVQGENGNITVPDGRISISETGEIFVDGELNDIIRVVGFEDKMLLRKQGYNLYSAPEEAGA